MSLFNRLTILNFCNACFSYWLAQKTEIDFAACLGSVVFTYSYFFSKFVMKPRKEEAEKLFVIAFVQTGSATIGQVMATILELRAQHTVMGLLAISGLVYTMLNINESAERQLEPEPSYETAPYPITIWGS